MNAIITTETRFEFEQRYWLRGTKCGLTDSSQVYEVYKGGFPDAGELVFTCVETNQCCLSRSTPQILEFSSEGTCRGRIVAAIDKSCTGEAVHSLVSPDGGNCSLAELKSTPACFGRRLSVSTPFFRSTQAPTGYGRIIFSALTKFFLLAYLIAFTIFIHTSYRWYILIAFFAAMAVLAMFAAVWEFRFSCGRVKREKLVELVGLCDEKLFADVYFVWNSCCNPGHTFEIVCYQEIDQNQLMLLVATAIAGRYSVYRAAF